jgi:hypothetical protein
MRAGRRAVIDMDLHSSTCGWRLLLPRGCLPDGRLLLPRGRPSRRSVPRLRCHPTCCSIRQLWAALPTAAMLRQAPSAAGILLAAVSSLCVLRLLGTAAGAAVPDGPVNDGEVQLAGGAPRSRGAVQQHLARPRDLGHDARVQLQGVTAAGPGAPWGASERTRGGAAWVACMGEPAPQAAQPPQGGPRSPCIRRGVRGQGQGQGAGGRAGRVGEQGGGGVANDGGAGHPRAAGRPQLFAPALGPRADRR